MARTSNRSNQTIQFLAAMLKEPQAWQHGYTLMKQTGLQSGTLVEREGYIQGPALRAEIDRAVAAGGASEQLWYVAVLERWLQSQQSAVPAIS